MPIKYVGLETLKRLVGLLVGDENGEVVIPEGSTVEEELDKLCKG